MRLRGNPTFEVLVKRDSTSTMISNKWGCTTVPTRTPGPLPGNIEKSYGTTDDSGFQECGRYQIAKYNFAHGCGSMA
jgi:hypothetical protein